MDPNEINKTKFCNKTINNIISNSLKEYILDDLKLRTNLEIKNNYAKIYNENYSSNLKKNDHIVCLKTFGSPYLLYCTKINNVNYCLLIDKKISKGHDYPKIFIIQYKFDNELFNGSLFECELVRDNSNDWFLLIGDIYYYKNKLTKHTVINERIKTIYNILDNEYKQDEYSDICPIQVKKYFSISEYNFIFKEYIPKLNYNIRGLYFIPINIKYSNILYFFNDNDLKQINLNDNYLNFKIIKTNKPEVYDLYLQSTDSIVKIDYALIPNIKTSKYLKDLFDNDKDVIVKCEYNTIFKKWKPLEKTNDRINHVNDLKLIN